MIIFPNCKINLGLYITQKRPDGYHNIESVFYPLALHDALEIVAAPATISENKLTVSGNSLPGLSSDNLCSRALQLLKQDFPHLPIVRMHLHKMIPSGAGLGGGSADGTYTLLLLNRQFNLGLTQNQLLEYASRLGSDCPFFVLNTPCVAMGRGELLEPIQLDLAQYQAIIVHPGIHVSTAEAFSAIRPEAGRVPVRDLVETGIEHWKNILVNDFEPVIFKKHPEIMQLKQLLYEQGAVYASMSGSGSSVYGIFRKGEVPALKLPVSWSVYSG